MNSENKENKHSYTYKELFKKLIKEPVILCFGTIALIFIIYGLFFENKESEERIIDEDSVNQMPHFKFTEPDVDLFSRDNSSK